MDSLRRSEDELIVLKAREATLSERAEELRTEQLQKLKSEREALARRDGQPAEKLAELDRQIQRFERGSEAVPVLEGDRRNMALIASLERSLESIDTMRGQIQKLFEDDLSASKKAEITQLAEANLRSNLERQRTLFDSVASQLKQAQIVSDFGSVTAQTINPPSITPIGPRVFTLLTLGLLAGCGLGGGVAYLVDLFEARVRTMSELKSILELPVIAVVPQLTAEQVAESSHVALLSHHSPRSFLA